MGGDQADMNAKIASIKAVVNGIADPAPLSALDIRMERILRNDASWNPPPPQMAAAIKAAANAAIDAWAAGHNAANSNYDDFYDFMLTWLDTFPELDQWDYTHNFEIQHNLYDAIYRDQETGPTSKVKAALTAAPPRGRHGGPVAAEIHGRAGGRRKLHLDRRPGGVSHREGRRPHATVSAVAADLYDWNNLNTVKTQYNWRVLTKTDIQQTLSDAAWVKTGKQATENRHSVSNGKTFDEIEDPGRQHGQAIPLTPIRAGPSARRAAAGRRPPIRGATGSEPPSRRTTERSS